MGELIYFPKVNYQPGSPKQNFKSGEVIPFPIQDIKLHKYLLQFNPVHLEHYFLNKKYVAQLQHYRSLTEAKEEFSKILLNDSNKENDNVTVGQIKLVEEKIKLLEEVRTEVLSQLVQFRYQIHMLDEQLDELSEKSPVKVKSYHPQIKY